MKLQQQNFNKQLKKFFLIDSKPSIAVAVSGGPDSMALIFLLYNWIKLYNGKIIALIVDHRLRKESSKEAIGIKNYLNQKKIEAKILSVRKKNILKKNMSEARNNRFNQIFKYCLKNKIFYLFLGHHQDDNLETFVLRKIAGSNFDGLRCMKIKTLRNKILIARPLLSYKKKDLIEFNKLKNIQYINDPTNRNLDYTRTIVRNFLLKNFKYRNQIKSELNSIEKYFPIYREMIFYFFNKTVIRCEKNKVIVKLKDFLILKKEIQIKILEIVYNFLMSGKKLLRYAKISKAIDSIKLKTVNEINLAGMKASKLSNKLMLYK